MIFCFWFLTKFMKHNRHKNVHKWYSKRVSSLTLEYIHVVFVTLTPTPGRTYPVYTPLNEIIKIIKCDLNWSQYDLSGPGRGSVTFINRLQVLSDVTLTDIKNFHFGDLIFFKYCMFSIVRVEVTRPISRVLDQLKIFWKIFYIFIREGWEF